MAKIEKRIIVNADVYETRIATLEDGLLVDLGLERAEHARMIGDIYKGTVKSIHIGMQSAFVDIGTDMNGFLHVSDIDENAQITLTEDKKSAKAPRRRNTGRGGRRGGKVGNDPKRRIENLLKKDQELMVQIIKEPISTKGPRITTKISFPGRYAVMVPRENYIGISKRIEDRKERKRLRELVDSVREDKFGIIVRTEGENRHEKEFTADIEELMKTWEVIEQRYQEATEVGLVYKDLGATLSFIRDMLTDDIDEVIIDSKDMYQSVIKYLKGHAPHLKSRIELYKGRKITLFDKYGLNDEIDKMLKRKVWCKKGGYLIIDRTEALTTIDINSGRYAGKKDREESIFFTNMIAVREIYRQVRLRDIGGLIVLDFIDMKDRKNRRHIYDEMVRLFNQDKAKQKILQINDLGVMVMSRQRQQESIPFTLSESCPMCEGLGRIVSGSTLTINIERDIKKYISEHRSKEIKLTIHPFINQYLPQDLLADWEHRYKTPISLVENTKFKYSQYELLGSGQKSALKTFFNDLFSDFK